MPSGVGESYARTVFANQPANEGTGYTDAQLLDFGKQAGLTGAAYDKFAQCAADGTYNEWAANSNEAFAKEGRVHTPTILLNGTELTREQLSSTEAFTNAIADATK